MAPAVALGEEGTGMLGVTAAKERKNMHFVQFITNTNSISSRNVQKEAIHIIVFIFSKT